MPEVTSVLSVSFPLCMASAVTRSSAAVSFIFSLRVLVFVFAATSFSDCQDPPSYVPLTPVVSPTLIKLFLVPEVDILGPPASDDRFLPFFRPRVSPLEVANPNN